MRLIAIQYIKIVVVLALVYYIVSSDGSHNIISHMVYMILCIGKALPSQPVMIEVTTSTNSVNISWMVPNIIFDQETYSVQYGIRHTMMLLDTRNVTGNSELSTVNEMFSITINGLTPFTRYYFTLTATNSFGSTSNAATDFTTNEAGMLLF